MLKVCTYLMNELATKPQFTYDLAAESNGN